MQNRPFILTIVTLILGLTYAPYISAAESKIVTPQHVSASIITATNGLDNDSPTRIGIRLQAPPHWHTYWRNPADSGMPTKITLTLPEGYTQSAVYWPVPQRIITSDIISFGYQGDTVFPLVITPPRTPKTHSGFNMASIKATVEWLACNEICVPESADLQLLLPEESAPATHATHSKLIEDAWATSPTSPALPIALDHSDTSLTIHVASSLLPQGDIQQLDIFPLTQNVVSYKTAQSWNRDDTGLHITLNTVDKAKPDNFSAVLVLTQQGKTTALTLDNQATIAATTAAPIAEKPQEQAPAPTTSPVSTPITQPEPTTQTSFLGALLLAFMGGLILNVMPCVLPVLSLKLLSLAKKAQSSKAESLRHGMAYSAGVMSCFTILGIALLVFQQAGELVGWGFQLQSPIVLAFLMILMMLVGLNLIGAFSVPDVLGSAGMSLTTKNNALGSFFTGALAAVAATPCTAPFMAPAVGFALTQSPLNQGHGWKLCANSLHSPCLLRRLGCYGYSPAKPMRMHSLRHLHY
jgi:DsbC/DsbD-like thiol-disulfide interchange protein/cytochrome c biogenesis protein CcdA